MGVLYINIIVTSKYNIILDGVPLKEERMRVTVIGNSNIKFTRTINSSDSGKYTCHLEAGDQSFEREYHLEVLGMTA